MSNRSTALAYQPSFGEPMFTPSAPAMRPQMVSTDATASDEGPILDWFADLTWRQILPIATLVMTIATGLMCASMLTLGV